MPHSQATSLVDPDATVVEIFGVRYTTDLFRHLALGPVGSTVRILSREDGVVTLQRLAPGSVVPAETGHTS